MEDHSYQEIADILEVPLGTVRSRISRGMAQLQQLILMDAGTPSQQVMPGSAATAPRLEKAGDPLNQPGKHGDDCALPSRLPAG